MVAFNHLIQRKSLVREQTVSDYIMTADGIRIEVVARERSTALSHSCKM